MQEASRKFGRFSWGKQVKFIWNFLQKFWQRSWEVLLALEMGSSRLNLSTRIKNHSLFFDQEEVNCVVMSLSVLCIMNVHNEGWCWFVAHQIITLFTLEVKVCLNDIGCSKLFCRSHKITSNCLNFVRFCSILINSGWLTDSRRLNSITALEKARRKRK